jgi:hypothetical protein
MVSSNFGLFRPAALHIGLTNWQGAIRELAMMMVAKSEFLSRQIFFKI